MSNQELGERMQRLAEFAVVHARDKFQTALDSSEESLKLVDQILDKLHDDFVQGTVEWYKGVPTEQQIGIIAAGYGAYVGEAVRRRWGGEWENEESEQNQSVIRLSVRDVYIFPQQKVYKRIVNGAKDSIWWYYQALGIGFNETA